MRSSRLPQSILVTGGCGFLGQHLVRRLVDEGVRVTVLDDLSTGRPINLPEHRNIRLLRGSVVDPDIVAAAAEDAEMVFHLAAVVGMRLAFAEPERSFAVSDAGTANILAATDPAPIVLISSSAVYGHSAAAEARETDGLSRSQALEYDGGRPGYAWGKQRLEQLGLVASERGRRVLIVRPFNVVGQGQSGAYGMVLPTFVRQALKEQPLTVFDHGSQRRCFSDVQTFMNCLMALLDVDDAWRPGGNVVNIGSASATSIMELAELVLAATRSSSEIRFLPFDHVFPGKTDVRDRRPVIGRLQHYIGSVEWQELKSIVQAVVDELRDSAVGFRETELKEA